MTNEQTIDGLAHEAWAAAQLAPGEGVEDGARRIAGLITAALAAKDAEIERLQAQLPEPAKPAKPEPGKWIEWNWLVETEDQPVGNDVRVDVKFRNGELWDDCVAGEIDWPYDLNSEHDIIAYLVRP